MCRYRGDTLITCYEHRFPTSPWMSTLLMKCLSESLSKSKNGHEKIKRGRNNVAIVWQYFLFKLLTSTKSLTEERQCKGEGKGHILEVRNQHILSITGIKWYTGWLPGMVKFLKWYELPLHHSKFTTAMTPKVDRSFSMTTLATLQRLSHLSHCV